MPWYRTGTVSVTNGSTTVTGSGTNWIDGAAVGEAFIGPDAKVYEIASIASATQITLATAYQGTTQTGQSYQIVPSQSYIRDLAAQAATLVSNYGTAMTSAGQGAFGDGTVSAPGVRFTADGDTGLRRVGTNSIAVVAGGADRLTVDTAGASVTGNLSVSGTLIAAGSLVGNVATATKLQTARTITIGNTGKAFDGSADVSWSLAEIGVDTDMVNMGHTAIMQALGLVRMAHTSIDALRYGPYQQQGELLIRNRGVVQGCAVSKSTTAARNLNISAGRCFAGGNVFTVAQQDNAASVPPNTGSVAVMVSAYLYPHASGTYKLAVTAIGQTLPDDAIEIYRLTIPAGSTAATDPYLANVTLTDVRRIESSYPELLDIPPSVSLAFARPMRGTDWRMDIDVVSFTGAPCRADQIVITNRATNGCTLWLGSAADDVRIRWQTTRLHD